MKKIIAILLFILTTITASAQRSEGTAAAKLTDRLLSGSLPKLKTSGSVEGTVIIAIWVDQYGNVQKADALSEGSTITNESVKTAAKNAAMRAHFNAKADAPALQEGTITYSFESFGAPQTDETALKFMGIPITGSKADFAEALKTKGFKAYFNDEPLEGIFNGENVKVYISTNHDVVDRIKVYYPAISEENNTRIKYNTLLARFNRNAKYVSLAPRQEIPADERLYWKLNENTKYYDVAFFYLYPDTTPETWKQEFNEAYGKRYKKPVETLSYEELEEVLLSLPTKVTAQISGIVWFTLVSTHTIVINYDNLKNRPRGEDL